MGTDVPGEAATGTTWTDLVITGVDYKYNSLRGQRRYFIVTNMVTYNLYNILNSNKYSFKKHPTSRATRGIEWHFQALVSADTLATQQRCLMLLWISPRWVCGTPATVSRYKITPARMQHCVKPSISCHSKPRTRSRTRHLKCFVFNTLLKQNIWNASYKTLYEALND